MKLPETKSINLAISKIIFYLLLFFTISCKNGLPVNVFDPESFLGFLVGLDPWRYNPPPKSKIKILGAVSSISEGETIQVGVVLENNPNADIEILISSNLSTITINDSATATIQFNSTNYSTEQKISINAGIDPNVNTEIVTISLSGNGLETQTIALTVTDDLMVNLSSTFTTIQEGQTASIGLKLSKLPPTDKSVTVSSDNPAIQINGSSTANLSFTTTDFDTIQTLTILAPIDSNSISETVTLTFSMEGTVDKTLTISVIDDNSVQVTGFPSTILEGTTQNMGVRFLKNILSDNSITITSSNPSALLINGQTSVTLNYTTANGIVDQTISLQAQIDANLASESVTLNFTANGISPLNLNLITTDKDTQNIFATGAITTLIEGTSSANGNLLVRLTQDPGGTATITVTSSDTNALTIDPATTFLTFDSTNWNVNRNVNFSAIEDTNETSETVNLIFNTPGAPLQIYNITAIDNDTKIQLAGANSVNEGGTNTLLVSLSGNPGITRTITLSSNNPAITLSSSTLILTPSNYSQSITLSGIQDDNVLSESVTITGSDVSATMPTLVSGTRNVTAIDDDTMNIQLSGASSVTEGGTAVVKARLAQNPVTSLTVNFSSSNTGSVTVSPSSFSFDSTNWNIEQNLTITGVEEANNDMEIVNIQATAGGVTTVSRSVYTIENDIAPLISTGGASTVEEGQFKVLTVSLPKNPGTQRTVSIQLTGSTSSVNVSPTSFTFDQNNYNIPQTFIISALQDMNIVTEIFNVVATIDYNPFPIMTTTFTLSTTDDDAGSLALVLTDEFGNTISNGATFNINEGSNIKFKVKLNFEPPSDVTVNFSSLLSPAPNNIQLLTADQPTLTFTAANYAVYNPTVTVTANENDYIDDKSTNLVFTASGGFSATKSYNVLVKDNDLIKRTEIGYYGREIDTPRLVLHGGLSHIIFSTSEAPNTNLPVRFMCNYDGSSCLKSAAYSGTESPFTSSGGNPITTNMAMHISPLVLPATNSISPNVSDPYVAHVAQDDYNGNRLVLYRDYDNSLPSYNWWHRVDLTDTAFPTDGNGKGRRPNAFVYGDRLIVVTLNDNKAYLFNCSTSNFVCDTGKILSTIVFSDGTPFYKNIAVANGKMTFIHATLGDVSLAAVQCDLPATTNCTSSTILPGGAAGAAGWNFATIYDNINNRIIVAGNVHNIDPIFHSCASDMSSCNFTQYTDPKRYIITSAIIDPFYNKLFTFGYLEQGQNKLVMSRCNLDGSGCIFRNLSDKFGTAGDGSRPDAVLDTTNRKIYVVTKNQTAGNIPTYWSIPIYIED